MAESGSRPGVSFRRPQLAGLLAFLGAGVYLVQTVVYAFAQISDLDEGAYLYQGYLYARGVFHPFQPNGPWLYNPPLPYLIWGYLQAWFGPGLQTGRIFAILLGVLMLLAIWLAARRLGGAWWGAAAVWAVALNPALIKLYSMAESQVLVACLLAWALALALGEGLPLWQLAASAVLAGLVLLTRHNLFLVLPLLLVYIFWQHGKKAGLWATGFGLLTVLAGYLPYWPRILSIWTPWLPASWTPFLAAFRPPAEGSALLSPAGPLDRLLSFTSGFRFKFAVMAGSLAALILWPARRQWKGSAAFRAGVFLAVLFFSLLLLHLWAALFNNFCVFCVPPYVAFFAAPGLLLTVVLFSQGVRKISIPRQLIAAVFILALLAALGYASYGLSSSWLLELRIPRLKTLLLTGSQAPGIPVWDFLGSRFGLDYQGVRQAAPVLAALILGLVFFLVAWLVWRFTLRRAGYAWMVMTLLAALVLGTALSPLEVLAGAPRPYDCQADNIAANERAGRLLADWIPPGSTVYWDGGGPVTPLVYAPGIQILPGQIYDQWSFSPDPDTQRVLQFGMWNAAAAQEWRSTAGFIVVRADLYDAQWAGYFNTHPGYTEIGRTPQVSPCDTGSALRVFRRNP